MKYSAMNNMIENGNLYTSYRDGKSYPIREYKHVGLDNKNLKLSLKHFTDDELVLTFETEAEYVGFLREFHSHSTMKIQKYLEQYYPEFAKSVEESRASAQVKWDEKYNKEKTVTGEAQGPKNEAPEIGAHTHTAGAHTHTAKKVEKKVEEKDQRESKEVEEKDLGFEEFMGRIGNGLLEVSRECKRNRELSNLKKELAHQTKKSTLLAEAAKLLAEALSM